MAQKKLELRASEIDRNSPVPFYFQLAQILEHEILSNAWKPGGRLPSEPDLCEHFLVSRSTVRQALTRLEREGLLARHKGYGTYVTDRRRGSWLLQSADGLFQDEVDRLGSEVTSTVLRLEPSELPTWASEALELPEGSQGLTLERLRSVDGLVALYVVNYLPMQFADAMRNLADPSGSLYRVLAESHSIRVMGARRVLEAVDAGTELAQLLEMRPGSAVAFVESVSWDANMRPFDCYRAWLRTDRLKIDVQVATSAPSLAAIPRADTART